MGRADMQAALSTLPGRRRVFAVLFVALAVAFAAATGADAAIITSQDAQGRVITFDVRAATVDTDWYAAVLRASAHGDEISDVTIRIVPEASIAGICGAEAIACYTGRTRAPTIIVPAGQSTSLEATLLHEYGHHLDTAWSVPGVPELNGTPVWWAARGMASLLSSHRVAFDYSLGWSHSIAEVFAEDYAYIHVGAGYGIPWLTPPDAALKSAMFAELGTPTAALPPARDEPLVIVRNGTLAPRARRVLPFGLLGPGRHVTLTATVARAKRAGVRARALIVCDGKTVATQPFGRGRTQRTLDVPSIGPAQCEARLVSASRVSLGYTLRLRLAVEPTTGAG
jgi:hypothetical protein